MPAKEPQETYARLARLSTLNEKQPKNISLILHQKPTMVTSG